MKLGRYTGILALFWFSHGLLVSVLTLVMLDKGVPFGDIVLAMAAYSITAVLLEVPSGVAADILGRQRTFIVAMLVSAAAFSVILLAQGAAWVYIAVAIAGAGRAMSSGTIEALMVNRHNAAYGTERLPRAMRILVLTESLGLAAGALTGGFLPYVSSIVLPGWGAYDLNLLIRVSLCLLLALLAALLIPPDHEPKAPRLRLGAYIRGDVRIIRESANLKWLFVAVIGLGMTLCALESYWQPQFLNILGDEDQTGMLGVLSVLFLAAAAAGNLVSEKLLVSKKAGERTLFFVSRGAMLASVAGVAISGTPLLFMLFFCLTYFFLGVANIAEGAMIHREVPDQSRASMLSVQSLMLQMGVLPISAGASAIIRVSSVQMFWFAAIAGAAALLIPGLRFVARERIHLNSLNRAQRSCSRK